MLPSLVLRELVEVAHHTHTHTHTHTHLEYEPARLRGFSQNRVFGDERVKAKNLGGLWICTVPNVDVAWKRMCRDQMFPWEKHKQFQGSTGWR